MIELTDGCQCRQCRLRRRLAPRLANSLLDLIFDSGGTPGHATAFLAELAITFIDAVEEGCTTTTDPDTVTPHEHFLTELGAYYDDLGNHHPAGHA